MSSIRPISAALACILTLGSLAQPAHAQSRWDFDGGPASRNWDLEGPGVRMLYPELRDNRRGRAFVIRNFDMQHDGFITPREAIAANRAFADLAGPGRRYDWDAPRGSTVIAVPVERAGPGGWDRAGMRGYHFRQGREGATFDISDILFRTGSAELRPGAEARLQPLAGFLRANPGVRVAIDGNTDSVGSAESNLQLSRDRAGAVADALEQMGVNGARFRLAGHGEATPRATNATAQGRQLNRRVEVTLIGRRAAEFG
ncbi:OmpA family protein [Sphingomonas profundi]|uniref:OmpA family protein n=1 Tax=Alterirhizorhabdus profundi TaxID=2681549 RepID=UPI0012E7739D|nr:OmpA family protein [Sphingomonas profundi]